MVTCVARAEQTGEVARCISSTSFVAARQQGSNSRFQLIDNTDLAGSIPYLPKA